MALITDALSSYGCRLYHADATAPPVVGTDYTLIGGVFSIRGPGYAQSSVETTDLNSAFRFRSFKPGMADGGELSFDLRYIPSSDTHDGTAQSATVAGGILDNFGGTTSLPATNRLYRLEFADDTVGLAAGGTTTRSAFVFEGHYTRFEPSVDIDSAINASCSIKISGKPTFAQGV